MTATKKNLEDLIEKLEDKIINPFEFTQFVRGILFSWIQSIMLKINIAPDAHEILKVFITAVLKFIFKTFEELDDDCLMELKKTPSLYLVSLRHAQAAAIPELAHMLKLIYDLNTNHSNDIKV